MVSATVAKPGRRSVVIDSTIHHDGRLTARSTSQWVAPSVGWNSAYRTPRPPRPAERADPGSGDFDYPRPGFNADAAELRYVSGSNEVSGPAVIWARLTSPLIAGEVPSRFVQVATLADLAAAAGFERGPNDESYINPDLTLQLSRYPVDDWIGLDARGHRSGGATAYNEALVFDDDGHLGRILQSLVEVPKTEI